MKNSLRLLSWTLILALLALGGVHTSRVAAEVGDPPPLSPTFDWELILRDEPTRVWRSPHYATDRALYVATEQEVYRTTDDGDSWTTLFATTPYSPNLRITAIAWDPDATIAPPLFVARNVGHSHGEVFRSTDDGLTWQRVLTTAHTLLWDIAATRDAEGNLVVFAVGASPDKPAVWRSADGGVNWELADTGLHDYTDLYRVYPSPNFAADHTVYMTCYGPLHRSTDGGRTWEQVTIPDVDIPREVVFSPQYATDSTLWLSYFFVEGVDDMTIPMNGVVRSTDAGATWQQVNTGLAENELDAWIMGLAVSPDYPADPALYAVQRTTQHSGAPWVLYRSPNGGDRWWAQDIAPEPMPKGMVMASRDVLFVPTINGLWRLRNHAWEWALNGNAELDTHWQFDGRAPGAYSEAQSYNGSRSIRLGLVDTTNILAYSSARQWISLPASATSAELTLKLYPISTSIRQAALAEVLAQRGRVTAAGQTPTAPAAGDLQYILLMDANRNVLERLFWDLDNSQEWQTHTFDLSAYIGKGFYLHFEVYNDGGGGKTAMYVDDISLRVAEPPPQPELPPANPGALDPDFLLTDAAGYQSTPALAFNAADNEFLLVYRDAGGQPGITAQRVRSDGRLTGNALSVISSEGLHDNPHIAYLASAQRYLVVWRDAREPDSILAVYGQLLRRDGTPDGAAFLIAEKTGGQVSPRAAAGQDAFLVVWSNTEDAKGRIEGRRIGATGEFLSPRFDISSAETSRAWAPDVAYRPQADRYLVVWYDERGTDADIYAQQIAPDGTLLGDNIPVTQAPGHQVNPVIAAGPDDAVLVVWEDERNGGRDIYGQRFKSGDTFLGIDIPISTQPYHEKRPAIAVWETSGDSVFFVTWDAGIEGVHGQRVVATGNLIGAPFTVSDGPHYQAKPAIAVGRAALPPVALVVWEDYRASFSGVYGQRLDAEARHLGLPVGLTPLDGQQTRPVLAYSATSDRYLAVWHHTEGGAHRIMAYTLSGDGALAHHPFVVAESIQTPDLALDVAWDANLDHFLVVWSDVQGNVDNYDIFGQFVTLNAQLVGDEFTISSAPGQQHAPKVTFSPELARYLVVFESVDTFYNMTSLRGQFLEDDGTPWLKPVDENFAITMPGENQQARYPDVAYDAASQTFLIVWQDDRAGGWNVHGQRVAGDTGTLLPLKFDIAADPARFAEHPRLAAGPANRYLVVWQDTPLMGLSAGPTAAATVRGQIVDHNGAAQGDPITIAAREGYHAGAPDVAYSVLDAGYLIAWHSAPQGEPYLPDIYARRVAANGNPGAAILPIAGSADSARRAPVIATRAGHGEWLLAWEDYRADPGMERVNVYARRQMATWQIYLPLVMRNW